MKFYKRESSIKAYNGNKRGCKFVGAFSSFGSKCEFADLKRQLRDRRVCRGTARRPDL